MGRAKILILACGLATLPVHAVEKFSEQRLDKIQTEISTLQNELIQNREKKTSAFLQLKRVRKLIQLQQKEIQVSLLRLRELDENLKSLEVQKQVLEDAISKQKNALRRSLKKIVISAAGNPLDAAWAFSLDASSMRSYVLEKKAAIENKLTSRLLADLKEANGLEQKILEEKNKIDFFVQELKDQNAMLLANESMQKEALSNQSLSQLDMLKRIRDLKDTEKKVDLELKKSLELPKKTFGVLNAKMSPQTESIFTDLKGKLPSPVFGQIISSFGRSYNPKTNLLSFQKGISVSTKITSEVRSVFKGRVVYSGSLKNYGLIVIVEHPGQYYTLYGQLGEVLVQQGSEVEQGLVLGKTSTEPFYFEVRNKNIAVNPMQWLKLNHS